MKQIIYLIIIIFCLYKNAQTYIVLPFKYNYQKNDDNNITRIFNELLVNELIITLPMGKPKKYLDFYASMNQYIYYLEEGSCDNNYNTYSSYNIKESESFKGKNKTFCRVKLDECYFGEDVLYLYQDINLKSFKEIPLIFYYGIKKENIIKNNKKLCGKLGFKIENSPFRFYDYDNFITVLKKNNVINSYSWYIHFFDNDKKINNFDGAIIFDIFNSQFFSDFPFLKKDDDYNLINAKDLEGILAWTFNLEKIYYLYNDTKFEIQTVSAGLAIETDFIHSPEIYFESIFKNFFEVLIKSNICFLIVESYSYIYCEKKGFEKYKDKFPPLILKSLGLNKTYELNSDILFKDCRNIFLFMIIKPKYNYKIWTLGKIFIKNNNIFFDSNKKIIGYFDIIDNKNQYKSKDNGTFNKIKWILFIIFGIIVGIIVGKNIREKSRKLRANELEDNYEYLENKINNNENTKSISNYSEIKSKLYDNNE